MQRDTVDITISFILLANMLTMQCVYVAVNTVY